MAAKKSDEVGPGSRPLTHGQRAVQPKSGPRLDETIPGGYYIGEYGDAHDAENQLVEHDMESKHDTIVSQNETLDEPALQTLKVEVVHPAKPAAKRPAKKGGK